MKNCLITKISTSAALFLFIRHKAVPILRLYETVSFHNLLLARSILLDFNYKSFNKENAVMDQFEDL